MNTKKSLKTNSSRLFFLGIVLSLAIVFATEVLASEPCCSITGIDYRAGLVTAQNTATGQTFQFKVGNVSLLKTLKVGQGVYADFGTKQVSVDGAAPCCGMVNLSAPLKGAHRP